MPLKVFICYARKDMRHKARLLEHLAQLERVGVVQPWHDGVIEVGTEWNPAILDALAQCHVAIFLLSPAFLASRFINEEEVPRLLNRWKNQEIRIFPVMVYTCSWETHPLQPIQALLHEGKPIGALRGNNVNVAWKAVVDKLYAWTAPVSSSPTAAPEIDLSLPTPSARLVGRVKELELLKKWFEDPDVAVVGIIAQGGAGKSALSVAWLEQLGEKQFAGARRVFGWSFYSQGQHDTQTNSIAFFEAALPFFGHTDALPATEEKKAQRLVELLDREPCVLVLDGVEPLQHPPGMQNGQFRDVGLARMMRHLEKNRLGGMEKNRLVLLSSRQTWPGLVAANHKAIHLGPLSVPDGVELLKSLGVTNGLKKEFNAAVTEMKGHALALVLLGKLLASEHQGDISRRDCVKGELVEDQHAQRVLSHYDTEIWPENALERVFLQLLGLFDRPMTQDLFAELANKADLAKPLQGLPQRRFNGLLHGLQDAGLLQSEKVPWDTHPLVREYFGNALKQYHPDLFRQAHRVLFEFFAANADHRPSTKAGLEPLFRAVHHGCQAGEYKKAMEDVLWERVYRRGECFSLHKLGLFSETLAALVGFFDPPWERVVASVSSSESDRAWLLAHASFALMSLGRMIEAMAPCQAAMEIHAKQEDWHQAAIDARNLVDQLISVGGLQAAKAVEEQGLIWAEKAESLLEQSIGHAWLAHVRHYLGELEQSKKAFQKAESIIYKQKACNLYGFRGYRYCNLLLDFARETAEFEAVLGRGREAQKIAIDNQWLWVIALDRLTQARALAGLMRMDEAKIYFDAAVTGIRESGSILHTPEILIHRAEFLRSQGQEDAARADLDEALEICAWSGMTLWEDRARKVLQKMGPATNS
ncbi:MAG: toll/interleukin-1 receptor domain-containing protein [Magnetococcales bacterium]|nr:toll/interleukin-1 receptor domain-containing protein [Magnetococcales bacterium]